MVHYVGLDDFEGNTVYLWRYSADKLLSDRDFGKGPMDSAIVAKGTVSFVAKEDTLHLYALEGNGMNVFFYPERGDLTLTYAHPSKDYVSDKSSNPNSLNELMSGLWHSLHLVIDSMVVFMFIKEDWKTGRRLQGMN